MTDAMLTAESAGTPADELLGSPQASARLRPIRAGIINLWDYVDEEFDFADGRLALRGHNGSGKTKALEVLFPFILDGSLDARRLDPFSGENRTMKSNLLYRGQESEYGYVWLEFGGLPGETVTLVVGLRVHKSWDRPRPAFFITGQRIGADFGLLSADSRPLTTKHLVSLLGQDAYLGDKRGAYTEAVDARLFGLGRERYAQLIDLLLALRRPLLAKDLDPVKVSQTLTAGLSPVDEGLVDQAARDFENLAAVQKQYDDLTAANTAVRDFLAHYTAYLRALARDQLDQVSSRLAAVTDRAEQITAAASEVAKAEVAERAAADAGAQTAAELRKLRAQVQALHKLDSYKEHAELALRREHADKDVAELARERERLEKANEEVAGLRSEAATVAARLADMQADGDRELRRLAGAAEAAGLTRDGEPADTGTDLAVTAKARAVVRHDDIRVMRAHLAEVSEADRDRAKADAAGGKAAEQVATARQAYRAAEEGLDLARIELAGQLSGWAGRWIGSGPYPVLIGEESGRLAEVADQLGEPGSPSLAEALVTLTQQRRATMAAAAQRLSGQADLLADRHAQLTGKRTAIEAGLDDAPPATDQRTADRAGRPGAPLWRLVRFADEVPAGVAAAIEGALYGAGLLTAWVHPEPAMTSAALAAAEADGYLVAAGRPEREPLRRTLAEVLAPEECQPELVPAKVVAAVLACINLADDLVGAAAHVGQAPLVTAAAQFSYGLHAGARPKAVPEYIGAASRASRRAARIAELDAAIAGVARETDQVATELGQATAALSGLEQARKELPLALSVLEARDAVAEAATRLAEKRIGLDEATFALDAAVAEHDARVRRLRRSAADRGMPVGQPEVDRVEQATTDFERAAEGLVGTRAEAVRVTADLAGRQVRIDRLTADNDRTAQQLARRDALHQADAEELAVLEAASGSEFERVRRELAEVARQLGPAEEAEQSALKLASREHDRLLEARRDLKHGSEMLAGSVAELLARLRSFGPYVQPSLRPLLGVASAEPWPADAQWPGAEQVTAALAVRLSEESGSAAAPAGPDTGAAASVGVDGPDAAGQDPADADAAVHLWAVLPAGVPVVLAAVTAATRGGRAVTQGVVKNAVDRMWTAYRDFEGALKAGEDGYQPDLGGDAPFTVEVATSSGRFGVAAFAQKIAEDAESQRILLEERERTVLEDSLLTVLARQIHARVIAAKDLVREMDADLRSKPMSSGTAIGISWVQADNLTERQAAVSRLLDRDVANLGPDQLAELRGLLRTMIHEHRAASSRDTYREALGAVLDYRAWHAFELRMRQPGLPAERLTRKRHSEMSGGEKSAAIHLPLFAAANALYSSSKPTCPRLVALDEAFAGIDDRFRPELLGLTVKFDLDLFMTGHDLWVTYPTVPMIAHYDILHDRLAHAVSTQLVLWDGSQQIDAGAGYAGNEDLAADLLGFRPTRHVPMEPGGTGYLLDGSASGDNDDTEDEDAE